jgi:hypothetical protein
LPDFWGTEIVEVPRNLFECKELLRVEAPENVKIAVDNGKSDVTLQHIKDGST